MIYQEISPEFKQSRGEAVRRVVRGMEAIAKFWPQGLPQHETLSANSVPLCCQEELDYRYQLCVIGGGLGMQIIPLWVRPGSSRWKDRSAVYSYRIVRRKEVL